VQLGKRLFFDVNFSNNRTQSCATCHNPAAAFSDNRTNASSVTSAAAVSVGADGKSFGDRNTPALTYIALTPEFHSYADSVIGGFFLDGRIRTLAQQAREPMLDPLEMAMPDESTIAARVRANDGYRAELLGIDPSLDMADDDAVLSAALAAIAAFESSGEFHTFDSRYDRYLAGTYTMTADEAIGRELFFSDLTNCRHCHLNNKQQISRQETFSSFEYHNIGTPVNARVRQLNGRGADYVDPGLGGNPIAGKAARNLGKFKVPSLRNVAVTAPYMHNGVFDKLETAVMFYARHLASNTTAIVNPETGNHWRPAEVPETVDNEFLPMGQPLEASRVRQLVAFLNTLTDRRYEHLLEKK
jgi:cytochrome c peroxidase